MSSDDASSDEVSNADVSESEQPADEQPADEQPTEDPAPEDPATEEQTPDEAGTDSEPTAADPTPHDDPEPVVEEGETLFYEPGGSWWVTAIGPVLVGAVLIMEIVGPGQVHWAVLSIFAVILIGFSVVQVYAARQHVSVRLTEATLRQGTRVLRLSDIATVYPPNNSAEPRTWESARALGELPAVPRRRKGVGVKLTDGTIAQAWARDVDRFRRELTEAVQAVALGLPPRGSTDD